MHNVRYKTFDQLSFADILVYSKLPDHPFWSHVEKKIDFSFADKLCSVLYTGRGQHPYAPSLKLKVHLIQAYYAMSDRQTEEKIIGDLFMKRFLELPVDFFGFDHSTIGLDRTRMGTA
ncbi:transposase, partial [Cohnella cellulosilytica]